MGDTTSVIAICASVVTVLLGLVAFGVRLVLSGRLVSRTILDDAIANYEKQLQREVAISEYWRTAHFNTLEAVTKQAQQSEQLLQGMKTVEAFILSIPAARAMQPQFPKGSGGHRG